MPVDARRHVPALTVLLSGVSLAAVFAAALRVVPPGLLPHAPGWVLDAIPHVNAAVSVVAIAVIGQGWRWIRQGEIRKHRAAMLAGFGLFVAFLALYLYRVALLGPTPFGGSGAAAVAYYVVLGVHILLAVVCVPLLFYVLLLAATHPVAKLPDTNHPRVGRVAAVLWLVSFTLGIVVYLALYAG